VNILDVIKRTVQAFPGSYEGMAAALGTTANVLRNRVSRANGFHQLSLLDTIEIMEQARDANVPDPLATLAALAAHFDMALVAAGKRAPVGDLSLAERVLEYAHASADLGSKVIAAVADGQIDEAEAEAIRELRQQANQAAVDLEQTAETFAARRGTN
jgi:hypothetical protein